MHLDLRAHEKFAPTRSRLVWASVREPFSQPVKTLPTLSVSFCMAPESEALETTTALSMEVSYFHGIFTCCSDLSAGSALQRFIAF